jgi:polysaccharide export outer membrane protein
MLHKIGRLLAVGLVLVTAGCSQFPSGAAIEADIRSEAAVQNSGFAFYPVTRALIPSVKLWPAVNTEYFNGWPRRTGGSNGNVIAPGDIVDVTIWDSSENSLLTSAGARTAPLGALQVSSSGRIFLPYVGDVRIAGMSPDRARLAVQQELTAISPSAQVVLSQQTGRLNSVDLVAGVAQPGTYPLPNRNYSVLALIAQGGGIPASMNNPRVKLQRGHNVYSISAERLYDNPEADAIVIGGDKLIVEEDDRYFLSLGAAGKEMQVYFNDDHLTALEAIAQIGGVADSTADPTGILILREYPRSALSAGVRGPREEKVIFSIDITSADGLFAAKNFQIMPGDVVMATESPVNTLREAFSLFGSAFGVISRLDSF